MAKPATLPRWAETAAGVASGEIVQPNSARKDAGFSNTAGDVPTGGEFNWVLNTILAWCKYLNTITAEALTWVPRQIFNGGISIPVGQVDNATAGTNRQYVDDAVTAEAAARVAGDAALDGRVDVLESLDHEARITALEGDITSVYAAQNVAANSGLDPQRMGMPSTSYGFMSIYWWNDPHARCHVFGWYTLGSADLDGNSNPNQVAAGQPFCTWAPGCGLPPTEYYCRAVVNARTTNSGGTIAEAVAIVNQDGIALVDVALDKYDRVFVDISFPILAVQA